MDGLYDGEFFGFKVASREQLDRALREAVVAIDANVLLDLYRLRPRTSDDLMEILKHLDGRLVVPHQALREFWRRRQLTKDSPRSATKEAVDALGKSRRSMCAVLDTWAKAVGVDDRELTGLTAQVESCVSGLNARLQDHILPGADATPGSDRILDQLEKILEGRVTPALSDEDFAECVAEAKRRLEVEQPPGYLDAEKWESNLPEGGAGDYLVWYQATRYAKEKEKDLLIVTRDQKTDWWWRQQSEFLGPRHELALEYYKLTGKRLFMLRPKDLLSRARPALNIQVHSASPDDAGRISESAGDFAALRHGLTLDEEERELSRELDAIERSATAQGWTVRTRSDTAFRIVSRNGDKYNFPLGSAGETRDRLRSFTQELAESGLRLPQTVLRPVNEEWN